MKSRLLITVAATAVFGAVATGAAAQDWTGPYVALHIGGGLLDDDSSERIVFDTNLDGAYGDTVRVGTPSSGAGPNAFAPNATTPAGFCGGKAFAGNFAAGCISDDQVEAEYGLRLGWDFGMGGFLVGGLVEASSFGVNDHVNGFSTTPANYQFERGVSDAVYAVRARAGVPFDRTLVYATGGYAYANITERYTTSNTANSFSPVVNKTEADGYQAGGGLEYRINDRISLGGEYLYTSLSVQDPLVTRIGQGTAPSTNPFLQTNAAGTNNRRESDDFKYHSFRLMVSTRF